MTPRYLEGPGGTRLAVHELDARGPGIRLFVHGTSFHSLMLAPLAASIGGNGALGLDLRGHGRSGAVDPAAFVWSSLGDDVLTILDWLATEGHDAIEGVGHSAGATALLLAAARRPGSFTRLYCYEPIALNDDVRATVTLPGALAGAARRRSTFANVEEALTYFSSRPPLSGLDPAVLKAYVEGGTEPNGDDGIRLSCEPTFEAAVYRAGYEADTYDEIALVDCPVTVAFGGVSDGIGPACAPVVADAVRRGELVRVAGLSHLGPLEDPLAVAASADAAFGYPRN